MSLHNKQRQTDTNRECDTLANIGFSDLCNISRRSSSGSNERQTIGTGLIGSYLKGEYKVRIYSDHS